MTNDSSFKLPRRADLSKNNDASPKKCMSDNIKAINRKLSMFLYSHIFRTDFEVPNNSGLIANHVIMTAKICKLSNWAL